MKKSIALCLLGLSVAFCACGKPKIQKDSVVKLNYTLSVNGQVVDKSPAGTPFEYVQGGGQIIPGLEEALLGKRAGDKLSLTIPPEKAYGAYNPAYTREVDLKLLPKNPKPTPGMTLSASTPDGRRIVVLVAKVGKTTATLDYNHPLAGKTLSYEIEVVEVKKKK